MDPRNICLIKFLFNMFTSLQLAPTKLHNSSLLISSHTLVLVGKTRNIFISEKVLSIKLEKVQENLQGVTSTVCLMMENVGKLVNYFKTL